MDYYYQLVLGWNFIGFVCSQLSSYADHVVYKPNNKFISEDFLYDYMQAFPKFVFSAYVSCFTLITCNGFITPLPHPWLYLDEPYLKG